MADRYFQNFPTTFYNGQLCTDITRRTIIRASNTTTPFEFLPYELQHNMRSDVVAHHYYGNAFQDWLLLLSNGITDPYYEWYNDYETFEDQVIQKYGSLIRAQQLVKFYRNNWANDDTILEASYYNNNLEESLRKYWEPVYGLGLNIVGYKRKEIDTIQNTNQIWNYTLTGNGATFTVGEPVVIKSTGTDTQIGTGEVDMANSSILRIRNVSGNVVANSTVTIDIVGQDTAANVQSSNGTLWFTNISNTEFVYYSAVTMYDWEVEQNEERKSLNILGDNVADIYINEFERLMNTDVDPDTGRVEE